MSGDSYRAWQQASELPDPEGWDDALPLVPHPDVPGRYTLEVPDDDGRDDPFDPHYVAGNPPPDDLGPPDLAMELGRVRYERDLLVHQIQQLGTPFPDHTGSTGWWRTLQATACWITEGGVAALPERRTP